MRRELLSGGARIGAALWLMALLTAAGPTHAADFLCSWQSAVSSNWTSTPAWGGCGFPNNGANTFEAEINATGAPYTVTVGSDIEIERVNQGSTDATLDFLSGTTTLNSGNSTISQGNVIFNGGDIDGNGDFIIGAAAHAHWHSTSDVKGSGTLVNDGTLRLNTLTDTGFNLGRDLINNGTVNWEDEHLAASTNLTITNNGVWNDLDSQTHLMSYTGGASFGFDNIGTYNKTGAGSMTTFFEFNNVGTLRVEDGLLSLIGGGTNSGLIQINGGSVSFGTREYIVQGSVEIAAGASLEIGPTPQVIFDNVAVTNQGEINLGSGGKLRLQTDVVIDGGVFNIVSNPGGIDGPGDLTIGTNATMNWETGFAVIGGSNTTLTIEGVLNIDSEFGGNNLNLVRDLDVSGTLNWLDDNLFYSGTTIRNDGAWNDTDGDAHHLTDFGTSTFHNNGTYTKTGGGETTLNIDFINNGSIDIQDGGLVFDHLVNNGEFTVNDTVTAPQVVNTGYFFGDGMIVTTIDNIGGTIAPGNSAGTLSVTGDASFDAASTLEIEVASLAEFDGLLVSGEAALGGTLALIALGGYSPVSGDAITLLEAGTIAGTTFDQVLLTGFDAGVSVEIFYLANQTVQAVFTNAVPLPPAVWLLGTALAGLLRTRRAR